MNSFIGRPANIPAMLALAATLLFCSGGKPVVAAPAGYSSAAFVFSQGGCSGVPIKGGGFAFRSLRGSLYSFDENRGLKLARGRVLLVARSQVTCVQTRAARVLVQPESVAIIETGPSGLCGVYCLSSSSHERSGAMVQYEGAKGEHATASLLPGQELLIGTHDLSEEDLLSIDGIERRKIEATSSAVMPKNIRLYDFSLAQMADYDSLLKCREANGNRAASGSKLYTDVLTRVISGATLQKGFTQKTSNAVDDPSVDSALSIGSETQLPYEKKHTLLSFRDDRFIALSADAVYAQSGPAEIGLSRGTVIAKSVSPLKIIAGKNQVYVTRNGIALIKHEGGWLKVANLSDGSADSIRLVGVAGVIDVPSGFEALISADAPSLAQVYDVYTVGRRDIISHYLRGKGWVTTSEISVKDAIATEPLFLSLRGEFNRESERKLVSQVMKTAAEQVVWNRQKSAFQKGLPDDVTGGTMRVAARCNSCLN